jgi:hypothetical protein
MANYVKATNFTAKDSLPSGDSGKIVKGAEIDTELSAVANAIASKADINSAGLTGTPTAPTATAGTATTQIATTAFVTSALSAAYPVGSIYINASSSSNPSVLLGFGTWTAFGAGRVMVGFNASDALFDTLEETGGSKDATLVSHTHSASFTGNALAGHSHTIVGGLSPGGGGGLGGGDLNLTSNSTTSSESAGTPTGSVAVSTVGSSGTNANLQPYITVRMWKRTA